jgi:hypothetical protein
MTPIEKFVTALVEPFATELHRAAKEAVDQAAIDRGIHWLESAQREYPEATALLLSFTYAGPKQVMKALIDLVPDLKPLKSNKHVLAYIEGVQQRLRAGGRANS